MSVLVRGMEMPKNGEKCPLCKDGMCSVALEDSDGICLVYGPGDEKRPADCPLDEVKRGKWIPVTERLSKGADKSGEICENVNLLLDDGLVTCGWMNGITGKVYYLNTRDDFVRKAPISRVTHWMPLPEPPKEE